MSTMNLSAQAGFGHALIDAALAPPPGLVAWNGSDPARRFAVYRNNVIVSLVGALAAKFPITRELVGDAFFDAMAGLYVRQSPPRSPMLAEYGGEFPAFIEGFAPADSVPYLADMARLEALRLAMYHAADDPALGAAELAARLVGDLAALHLRFVPSAAVFRADHAVFSLFAAHRGGVDIASFDPMQPEAVLVVRRGDEVSVTLLMPGDAAFLGSLHGGASLGAAVEAASLADPSFDPSHAFGVLLHAALIADVTSNETGVS
jgi:hypothetical protein